MKLDYKKYKLTETEFNNMSAMQQREYILQDLQEETMWWSRTANKIIAVSFVLGVLLMILSLIFSGSGSVPLKW